MIPGVPAFLGSLGQCQDLCFTLGHGIPQLGRVHSAKIRTTFVPVPLQGLCLGKPAFGQSFKRFHAFSPSLKLLH
jgi:hypothetical protein